MEYQQQQQQQQPTTDPAEGDPLQAALLEAECLMQSLGTGSFAIDSDEDNDDDDNNKPSKAAAAASAADLHPLHELYGHGANTSASSFVPVPPGAAPPPNSTAAPFSYNNNNHNNSGSGGLMTMGGGGGDANDWMSHNFANNSNSGNTTTATTPMDPMMNATFIPNNNYHPANATGGGGMDGFKASTTRFASNLALLAQRAANQVSTSMTMAAPITTTTAAMDHASSSFSTNHSHHQQHQFFPNAPQSSPALLGFHTTTSGSFPSAAAAIPGVASTTTNTTTTTTNNNGSSYFTADSPAAAAAPAPHATSSTTTLDPLLLLDTDQKTAWVQSHVGPLIPGERIIMFLPTVQHVSDSTGFQYNNNNNNNSHETHSHTNNTNFGLAAAPGATATAANPPWCCAMTFYRIILFSTTATTTTSPENHSTNAAAATSCRPHTWNAACWPTIGNNYNNSSNDGTPQQQQQVLQIPLANIDKVEKTVFTATTTNGNASGGYGTLTVGTTAPGSPLNPTLLVNSINSTNNIHSVHASTSATGMQHHPAILTTTLLGLVLHDKLNGRQLRFTTTAYADTNRAYEALQTYAFPGRRNLGYLFAFESKREHVLASVETDNSTGIKQVTLSPVTMRFDAVAEFQRQFANANHDTYFSGDNPSSSMPSSLPPWTVWPSTNASYQMCLSYPSCIAGPSSLDERHFPDVVARVIRPCAAFRSEQRLPALSWSGLAGSSIWRCSQPKIGLQGHRSSADELFLKHILERAMSANAAVATADNNCGFFSLPPRSVLVQLTGSPDLTNWLPQPNVGLKILDLRPRSSAMANRTGGYGYENTSNYPGCSLQFCNIANIHAVRDAYQKLSTLCLSTVSNDLTFSTQVEDTKWLSHIRLIWAAAWETAYWVYVHKFPVVIHCSHGWDRTSQVSALAQLLLDPHYRTKAGFATLVEKDFMSFGHPFHTRCGHGEGRDGAGQAGGGSGMGSSLDEGQISPIFIQFLDCVYQLVRLYPEMFEFNTKYLLLLSEHVYSCRFGNFLCDTEREREAVAGIRQRTHAVWDYLEEQRSDTTNQYYTGDSSSGGGVLLMPLPTLLRNICLWTDRHCMYSPKLMTRNLPVGVHRPVHPLNNDQPSDLVTEQETHQLLCCKGQPTVPLLSADKEDNAISMVSTTINHADINHADISNTDNTSTTTGTTTSPASSDLVQKSHTVFHQ